MIALLTSLTVHRSAVLGQTVPVDSSPYEDFYRRRQLLGAVDSSISFMVRPLTFASLSNEYDTSFHDNSGYHTTVWKTSDGFGEVSLLPIIWQNQVNTSYPYGWNDGPMIPAKGIQTYLSAGIYAKYRWLSVQFKPEIVWSGNSTYEGYGGPNGPDEQWYRQFGNNIDLPERFGISNYSNAFLGQSSIRLTLDPISIGLSTENLWWGPGKRNSILMSNTAPGFPHITLNTSKPIRSYIGSFEGQIVIGRLTKSGFPPSLLGDTSRHMRYYRPTAAGRRYFSGITVNYQPRWIPGFFLGFNRTYNSNDGMEGSFVDKYLPFLEPFTASRKMGPDSLDENISRDQMISFFFRYVIPKVQIEFYGEFARNDHAYDGRDLRLQLNHTRAYTLGLRKLIPLENFWDGNLQVAAEMTQMAVTNTKRIRSSGSWYVHGTVRDGHTNYGQVLGAGMGPGSNVQAVDLSWIRGLKQVGVQFERLVRNEDFATWIIQDYNRNWVDASIAAFGTWDYKRLVFNAHLQFIHAFNYQYGVVTDSNGESTIDPQDINNLHLQFGLMYRF
ncbi:capsule assembly Wzi family protein [Parapedobacter deserti]|uniref:capsule assembly Wzi family protein n=1 Tax=Parapedobacter deserti TaxID=1912957 RepID=UPI0036727B53